MISMIETETTSINQYLDRLGYIIGESGDFDLYQLIDQLNETDDSNIFIETLDQLIESGNPLMEITKPVTINVKHDNTEKPNKKPATSAYKRSMGQKVKKHVKDFFTSASKSTMKQYKKGRDATASVTNDFETKSKVEDTVRKGVNSLGGAIRAVATSPKSIAKGLKKGLSRSKTYNKLKRKYNTWKSIRSTKKGDEIKAKKHFNKSLDANKRIKAINRTKRIKKGKPKQRGTIALPA